MKKPVTSRYNTPPTIVVFRRFIDTGEAIALFPCVPEGEGRCSSFMHVGQHATADYDQTIAATVRATPLTDEDVRALCAELRSAPYNYHLKPERAEELVVEPGATAPMTDWALAAYVAERSVVATTAEKLWKTLTRAELVARYRALTRPQAVVES
jgi:hypothetical protein